MRNKRLLRTLSALCLTLVLASGFTVPAFAQGAAPPPAEDNPVSGQTASMIFIGWRRYGKIENKITEAHRKPEIRDNMETMWRILFIGIDF